MIDKRNADKLKKRREDQEKKLLKRRNIEKTNSKFYDEKINDVEITNNSDYYNSMIERQVTCSKDFSSFTRFLPKIFGFFIFIAFFTIIINVLLGIIPQIIDLAVENADKIEAINITENIPLILVLLLFFYLFNKIFRMFRRMRMC